MIIGVIFNFFGFLVILFGFLNRLKFFFSFNNLVVLRSFNVCVWFVGLFGIVIFELFGILFDFLYFLEYKFIGVICVVLIVVIFNLCFFLNCFKNVICWNEFSLIFLLVNVLFGVV